jgi:hypothetical protein
MQLGWDDEELVYEIELEKMNMLWFAFAACSIRH